MKIKTIANKIEKKLMFTNGWYIERERYRELCEELAKEIITYSKKDSSKIKKESVE